MWVSACAAFMECAVSGSRAPECDGPRFCTPRRSGTPINHCSVFTFSAAISIETGAHLFVFVAHSADGPHKASEALSLRSAVALEPGVRRATTKEGWEMSKWERWRNKQEPVDAIILNLFYSEIQLGSPLTRKSTVFQSPFNILMYSRI